MAYNPNTDYAKLMEEAFAQNNAKAFNEALNARQSKMDAMGLNGKYESNQDILNRLNAAKQPAPVVTEPAPTVSPAPTQPMQPITPTVVAQPTIDYTGLQSQLENANRTKIMNDLANTKNANLSNLSAEKAQIAPTYYNSRNQTATGSLLGAKNFAEYMAAKGQIRAGASGQAELNRIGTLQNNIGNLNVAENQALETNTRRVTDVNNAYNNDLQSAEAGLQAQSLQRTIDEMRRQQDIQREDANTAYNRGVDADNTAYNRTQDNLSREIDTVGGYYSDFQAEINKRLVSPSKEDDALIPYLKTAREQKIKELAEIEAAQKAADAKAKAEKAQRDFDNALKKAKAEYDINKPYYAPPKASTTNGGYGLEW